LNGNLPATPYEYVTYYAKTAYIEWNKIGKRWDELTNNTIGSVAPNTFPTYTIWVKDKTIDTELTDGMTVSKDTLSTYVECPTAVTFVSSNGKRLISAEVYGTNGVVRSKQNSPGVNNWSLSAGLFVKLTPGPNKLGYFIVGWNSKVLYDKSTDRIPLFIDFKWITVNYYPLSIDPNPLVGVPNAEYILTARSKGTAPKSSKYIWDFGDGSAKVTMQNDSTVKHTYVKEGAYNIKVELYDSNGTKKISEASSVANITSTVNLTNILKTRYISIYGKCSFKWTNGKDAYLMLFADSNDKNNPIKWNNRDFSVTYSTENVYTGGKTITYYSFSGTVSDDGKKLLTVSLDYKAEYYVYNKFNDSQAYKYTLTNIPLTDSYNLNGWRFYYTLQKDEVAAHVSSFDWHVISSDGSKLDFGSMKQYDEQFNVYLTEN
jgi:PKD domain